MKFSLFKNSRTDLPEGTLTLEQFVNAVKTGQWKKQVSNLRQNKDGKYYKKLKARLPAVTVSGDFKTRDKYLDLSKRLKKHSGYIAIDVDKKDNPKMRVADLVDRDALAQFASAGGEGIKIIYACTPVATAEEHRRIYDAVVQRLEKRGITLKVDPIVKSIASLQYVTVDPNAYYNPGSKFVVKPLPAIKRKTQPPVANAEEEIKKLTEYIEALGKIDVTADYENWLYLTFGLSYTLGELGRPIFHKLSQNYPGYSERECDEKYDAALEQDKSKIEKPITIASVYQIISDALPKPKAKQLAKKFALSHAVGEGEDVEQGDLVGMVRYKLFLFKKIIDKETNTIVELVPSKLNLNAFEALLRKLNFYRHEGYGKFVYIVNNVVESVDLSDILRLVTEYIEKEGDYVFTYKGIEYRFGWEEIVHRWREIRAQGTTFSQVSASLSHWIPNLLKDGIDVSYVPYQNGVAQVTAKAIKLIPYDKLEYQIWKERILPRNFVLAKSPGMFEDFFVNVMGRGKSRIERIKSENYKRALWYYGYILQGSKRQSTARAWILYDTKPGNNGRTGKTIIGTAVGKIRSVTVIDGKQVDLTNRFAFQTVEPWTDVVFIDDPSKYMSLVPFFNMISGQTTADKKGTAPVVKDFKFLIASNWILEAEGSSESGRQFVSQLDDFYLRYAKANDDTITPIVDLHGKEFFTDWDDKDWNQFDTFSLGAIQYHLKAESPSNTIIGNSAAIRFIQLHEEELYRELCETFRQYAKAGERGGTLIPQQVLTYVIKEHNSDLKMNKAGRIARAFLGCLTKAEIEITTLKTGGQVKMAYRIDDQIDNMELP